MGCVDILYRFSEISEDKKKFGEIELHNFAPCIKHLNASIGLIILV